MADTCKTYQPLSQVNHGCQWILQRMLKTRNQQNPTHSMLPYMALGRECRRPGAHPGKVDSSF